ncbi:3-phosphoshikimate 1-carboxyvinyltransferase [Lactobacillus nasalidis]|uniref:3-phosphoshikimate 1-carboxyvinyltransferase n=1 Tax=Lactobacillus nasalidis TaxID=2797258 RepID=A0ABQ3W8N8_9LACO|nr:3-phosphoshikimate 1-carboxyvinyltransferase [Lactobacillus nasalidis]GHV96948.1 3-phosphoshikimate 1-carboxyvinyltransferase [Lactobacillus nasalidis]GHV98736.1 3-phosphoshikimate 1-carboxyvinyltransferase [Lactobacillus nasalidis]GHW02022.1 3-phosphoshikimate 1-carboxyvinyltransferase [Lactobacillus nasalidis]
MKELAMAPSGLHGRLTVPGDKSISHRAVMLGSLAKGETRISNFLPGQDCLTTVKAFQDLGVKIDREGENLVVYGQGLKQADKALDMGNSGTTTRLLMGILAGSSFTSQMIGDASLSKRPMKRVSQPLAKFGAEIDLSPNGTLPATIKGQKLHGAQIQLEVASAQVKSAAIFAALAAKGPSTIIEKLPTRNHTEIMLQQFGADIATDADNLTIHVNPGRELTGQEVEVPGDMSSAAFWLTAGAIVPNSKLTLAHVNLNPTRTGIVQVLKQMGAKISIEQLPSKGEELGNLTIETSQLAPVKLTAEDIPAVIDELPLVALLAACAEGTSEIRGAEELRVKETDRIKTVSQELGKLGVEVTELPDGMIIKGRKDWQVKDDNLDSYGDHRLGMMAAIAALKSKQPLKLANEGSISVSYPGFFSDLEKLLK